MIFVDALTPCLRNPRWRHDVSCQLADQAGNLDALHAFATRIGLKRCWFQRRRTPHYDLTAGKRIQAVAAGAIEIDRKRLVEIIELWRAEESQSRLKRNEVCETATAHGRRIG